MSPSRLVHSSPSSFARASGSDCERDPSWRGSVAGVTRRRCQRSSPLQNYDERKDEEGEGGREGTGVKGAARTMVNQSYGP